MQVSLQTQLLSFAGAMLILIGYLGHQMKWLDARRPFYNAVNTAGAAILAYIALRPLQVGFAIMEVTWTIASIIALVTALRAAGREHAR
jgi:hypothetical protein